MADPVTSLHYAANGNLVNGVYAPGVDGFNLADVSSAAAANELPAGVTGLVWLGNSVSGVTASFEAAVNAAIGDPKVNGFYLADEPGAGLAPELKAEADYIHSVDPGAVTFMVEQNLGSNTSPVFAYTPANTDIDLFGLDPYPIQTNVPNNLDYNIIPLAVSTAEADGIPQKDIVPVYQSFGGGQYTTYILPTAAQEQQILSTWGSVVPTPKFDYAYSWGVQDGDTAISNDPALQQVFAAHNGVVTIQAAPTVAITSVGGTTDQASQTVVGTVDVADAGTTVSILDGTSPIGSAVVAANGSWSANVTLANPGANVLTATDTNAAGTGTSAPVTFTLETAAPTGPTLSIADSSLSVAGGGGTVELGISVTAPASSTATTVTIKGLPRYETITDNLDDRTFRGTSITLSEAEVDSGLTLTSNYRGSQHPVATLTIKASDEIGGVSMTSAPQTITVDDPPASTPTGNPLALLNQYMASGFNNGAGDGSITTNSVANFAHDESFLTSPRH